MDMNEILQPLLDFEKCGGKGIVYGGALRDSMCGRGPIKDIDIAVQNTVENELATVKYFKMLEGRCAPDDLWSGPLVTMQEQLIGYGNFPDVYKSVQISVIDLPYTINFVVLKDTVPFTVKDIALRCDFGICQVATDGNDTYTSPDFASDKFRCTFTYVRDPFDPHQFGRSLRRFERLTGEKYQGWLLRVPSAPDKGTYRECIAETIEDTYFPE